MSESNYVSSRQYTLTQNLRGVLKELPPFCADYFRATEDSTTILTRLNYAYDLRVFFNFLIHETSSLGTDDLLTVQANDLNKISLKDLELYFEYLSFYSDENDTIRENKDRGKLRKIASLRSFFKYFYKKSILKNNYCTLLETPKLYEKPIIRLNEDEVAHIVAEVRSGEHLSEAQKRYHNVTQKRDVAIITLFLSTGIRVSELVGLNISDIDLEGNAFKVTRKGGNQVILYFNNATAVVLDEYLDERKAEASYSLDSPMFLSLQKLRISVRSVENLVKKYARIAAPLKKISPHKLRSTYGTMLYNNTGDIYLVADVLGHKDVNTTRKHYAAIDENRRREAASAVTLPESEKNDEKI